MAIAPSIDGGQLRTYSIEKLRCWKIGKVFETPFSPRRLLKTSVPKERICGRKFR